MSKPQPALPLLQQTEQIAIIVKMIMRALEGLEPTPNKFENLLNLESDIERARLSHHLSAAQIYCELLSKIGGPSCFAWDNLARLRNAYGIPIDGEGRKEYILARRTSDLRQDQQNVNIQLPNVITKPQPEQKRRFWQRNKQPTGPQSQ